MTKRVSPFTQNVYIHLLYKLRRSCGYTYLAISGCSSEKNWYSSSDFQFRLFY